MEPGWVRVALELAGFIIGAIWVVASIRATNRLLTNELRHLTIAVGKLEKQMESNDTLFRDHERRIIMLESAQGSG